MARFAINQPITTREPSVTVDAGLTVGRHRFQLEVIDSAGNRSRPDIAVVEVRRLVLEPVTPIAPTGLVVTPRSP